MFRPMKAWLTVLGAAGLTVASQGAPVRFAVIGDYGKAGTVEQTVADLVKSWNVDFIITTGDNNYPSGQATTIDANIGQYYHDFIAPYTGAYGPGAPGGVNRFFPVLGNHDYVTANGQPYLDYFTLPGNERYYDFAWGPVHFFALDSVAWGQTYGTTPDSVQGQWLKAGLAAAAEPWKIVYFHYPPFSSALHGSTTGMQWPFAEWGADAVLAGHDHTYERLSVDGIPYFVNGVGGNPNLYGFNTPLPESVVRYNAQNGAMRVDADTDRITFRFYAADGTLVDEISLIPEPGLGGAAFAAALLGWAIHRRGARRQVSPPAAVDHLKR